MARSKQNRELIILLNHIPVGTWSIDSQGIHRFQYFSSWFDCELARPISLSLPLTSANQIYQGAAVQNFFENLLPDSTELRQKIKLRFDAESLSAFDLLSVIGRDCVGALQILPPEKAAMSSSNTAEMNARSLTDDQFADLLMQYMAPQSSSVLAGILDDFDEFRISLAGAQEKTALLNLDGRWYVPHGATPTTHIIKFPLGKIGGMGLDLRNSVENEWLCAHIANSLGLESPKTSIATVHDTKVLIVERFDRRIVSGRSTIQDSQQYATQNRGKTIIRIPQEDFCQITGTPPTKKYQADGGPGIEDIMQILLGSTEAQKDRENFFKTQLLFWLLAAPDGHAKNYSVFLERGGRYKLTPVYDIISGFPLMGHGRTLLPPQKLKMAMAFWGKSKHYHWAKITLDHMFQTAQRCGMADLVPGIIDSLIKDIPQAIQSASQALPGDFPPFIADSILGGLAQQCKILENSD